MVGAGGGGGAAVGAAICSGIIDTTRRGRGALKSCTRVPLILGSYTGSEVRGDFRTGAISAAFCAVLRRASRVDIGFFKNGKPFFGFCGSITGDKPAPLRCARVAGSVASLVPAGLLLLPDCAP